MTPFTPTPPRLAGACNYCGDQGASPDFSFSPVFRRGGQVRGTRCCHLRTFLQLHVGHGVIGQNHCLENVLFNLEEFLEMRPTEFVMMRLKDNGEKGEGEPQCGESRGVGQGGWVG